MEDITLSLLVLGLVVGSLFITLISWKVISDLKWAKKKEKEFDK